MAKKVFWKMPTMFATFGLALALVLTGCPTDNETGHTHDWGEWVVTTAPTCTTEGVETRTCNINPTHVEARAVAIDPDAHEWDGWEVKTAPTCTEPGTGARACTLCGEQDTVIPALGHDMGGWQVTIPPTYTTPGEEAGACQREGCNHTGTRPIPPLGGDGLAERLDRLRANAVGGGDYLIVINRNETVVPQALEFDGRDGITVRLLGIGTGITVSLSEPGNLFTIPPGVTLILENVTLRGRDDNDSSLVGVWGGTLIMETGSRITGNTRNPGSGAGVIIGDGGRFYMNDGKISGNHSRYVGWAGGGGVNIWSGGTFTMNGGVIYGNTVDRLPNPEGGIGTAGGGVRTYGTFTMTGGKVSGNTARAGSGVYVGNGGIFTMTGGEISDNTAPDDGQWSTGGGVRATRGGNFVMYGGNIFGNTVLAGGGVYVYAGGVFDMYSGTISGNNAHRGGGVDVTGNGVFTMHDGSISDNDALGGGGGVHAGGTFYMYGGEIFDNNASDGGGVRVSGIFSMHSGCVFGNHANVGGGVHVWGGTAVFRMRGGTIFNNSAAQFGGGGVSVWNDGVVQISDGVIYGRNAPTGHGNTAAHSAALYVPGTNTAQHGTFNDAGAFSPLGDLPSVNNTIEVEEGVWLGLPVPVPSFPDPVLALPFDPGTVNPYAFFSMAHDDFIQGLAGEVDFMTGQPGLGQWLARAGGPRIYVMEDASRVEGSSFLRVTSRPTPYSAIDVRTTGQDNLANFEEDVRHVFTVWGHATPGADVRFEETDSPHGWHGSATAADDGLFMLRHTFTWAELSRPGLRGFRIIVANNTADFEIFNIAVVPYELPPGQPR